MLHKVGIFKDVQSWKDFVQVTPKD